MGNCIDKGDSNAGADGKGAAGFAGIIAAGATEFVGKADAGRVTLSIKGEDKTFTLNEYEGEGEEAKTAWAGIITEAEGVWTFDASAADATTSETKTFIATLTDAGHITLGHKFIGDIEQLDR